MFFIETIINNLPIILVIVAILILFKSIRVVPAQSAYVVERLGKYNSTYLAGFHILIPFIDKIQYKHSLKEKALPVPPQPCFTEDNVKIDIDGVLYFKVTDPVKASYGITKRHYTPKLQDYEYATIQLAQTMMRSVIGKMDLDTTFEERERINAEIIQNVDQATTPWGISVTRYEIQNIDFPQTVLKTMEKQVQADRDKRARILDSEGDMMSRIRRSEGELQKLINISEGQKEKMINEAEGKAAEILSLSKATAISITKIADAISNPGGKDALTLQLTEDYITSLSSLSKNNTNIVLPLDMTNPEVIVNKIKKSLT
ncbi:paraslipin [Thiospirochaeta perfilievii]|uniref:Paraslipin n=1 Tax=Thiospirochaeta perfilievii TaxID=252967 RepID=A0A5C1QBA4_9SPIO|nr:stomatin-like protein [Thiospirochaeta perfilievii]QEN04801.1 paraslipin [Thiospirochaeta perfilievii]